MDRFLLRFGPAVEEPGRQVLILNDLLVQKRKIIRAILQFPYIPPPVMSLQRLAHRPGKLEPGPIFLCKRVD